MSTLATKRKGRRPRLSAFLRPPPQLPIPLAPKHPVAIQALPQPDWIGQTVTFTGSPDQIGALKQAASGSRIVPWVIDYDRREESFFLWLVSPQGGRRGLSIPAAHRLARQLREAEWALHETAAARAALVRAVPFDLHALVPVPSAILRLGPDDPAALRWLWEHWGTTWELRRVELVEDTPDRFAVRFFSADWTPWPALRQIQMRWPELTLRVTVEYG